MIARCLAWYLCLVAMLAGTVADADPSVGFQVIPPEPWPAPLESGSQDDVYLPDTGIPPAPIRPEWVTVMALITAYQPDHDCAVNEMGTPSHLTATRCSTDTHPYGIAADPSLLPYGTSIIVPDYLDHRYPDRAWQVDDTGGALRQSTKGHGIVHLDLRYRTLWSALKHGKCWSEIWVDITGWPAERVARLRMAAQAGERLRRRGVMP